MAKIYDWRKIGLQSMDWIICAGRSPASKGIGKFQELTGAPKASATMSHVAGAIDWSNGTLKNELIGVQESTSINEFSGIKGVQQNFMDIWLTYYDGDVFVRKLDFCRDESFHRKDEAFWQKHKNDSYESGIPGAWELFLCGLRLHRFVRWVNPYYMPSFTDEPHCTELVAMRMKVHGLLNEDVPINRLPPWEWCSRIDRDITCPVGELIQIKG
jgi:hypothetical protein